MRGDGHWTVRLDDDRTIELSFRRGEDVKAFTLKWPTMIYRGVFKEGTAYVAGDGVTFGGSLWIAQGETKDKPGTSDAWRLSVKKGRDGRDGVMKPPPSQTPRASVSGGQS